MVTRYRDHRSRHHPGVSTVSAYPTARAPRPRAQSQLHSSQGNGRRSWDVPADAHRFHCACHKIARFAVRLRIARRTVSPAGTVQTHASMVRGHSGGLPRNRVGSGLCLRFSALSTPEKKRQSSWGAARGARRLSHSRQDQERIEGRLLAKVDDGHNS